MNKITFRKETYYKALISGLIFTIVIIGSYALRRGEFQALGNEFIDQGQTKSASTAAEGHPAKLLKDYTNWPSSETRKANDALLDAIFFLDAGGSRPGLIDINGDGLTDIVYHDNDMFMDSGNQGDTSLLFLNNGNNNFELIYKCAIDTYTYYGDCADV